MKKSIELDLTAEEKQLLKQKKVPFKTLIGYAPDEIVSLLNANEARAREINALIEFQSIPSLGHGFAKELLSQGYYSLEQLRGKDAVTLFEAFEKHCGAWADPCVEDSYRLLAHYIEHRDDTKKWWSFTNERKAYRAKHGFKTDRPKTAWYELERYKRPETTSI
jgi:Pathogenicity locus